MSVRTMTTDALQKDLNAVMVMFNGAPPPEQNDRVNALRSELKRRGVETRTTPTGGPEQTKLAPIGQPQEPTLGDLTDDQLKAELEKLAKFVSANPFDDEAQNRFADARFETRRRTKTNGNGASNGNGQAIKAPLPDNAAPEPVRVELVSTESTPQQQRLVPRDVQQAQSDVAAIAERNAAAFREIERTQMKLQAASLAAMTAVRLISDISGDDIRDVNGDQIAAACDVGIAVTQAVFAKLGLAT